MTKLQQLTPVQETWLTALESGKYRQCQSQLREENEQGLESFCVLGLACEIFQSEFNLQKCELGFKDRTGKCWWQTAPHEIREHLQFAPDKILDVIELNDSGYSFQAIADSIRLRPEAFFLPPEPEDKSCSNSL